MARIQVMHLPDYHDTEARTVADPPVPAPFALVIDQATEQEAERLAKHNLPGFLAAVGARGLLVTTGTLDVV